MVISAMLAGCNMGNRPSVSAETTGMAGMTDSMSEETAVIAAEPEKAKTQMGDDRKHEEEGVNMNRYIKPGIIWYDTGGNQIQAHGGGILMLEEEGQKVYYWYGEDKTHGYRPLVGIHAYKSVDLVNWIDCGVVLRAMESIDEFDDEYYFQIYGKLTDKEKEALFIDLDRNTAVMERPKVIYNAKNNNYVMWFHADGPTATSSANYAKAKAAVAVSESPEGPFRLLGSYRLDHYGGEHYAHEPGMARDMNLFVDDDGAAYIIYSSEENLTMYISRLNDDYTMITSGGVESENYAPKEGVDYVRIFAMQQREAPAMFKYKNKYILITSGCTGWEPNQAKYGIADDIMGEWTMISDPCENDSKGTTFDSQSTYVLPLDAENGKYMFMADRWVSDDLANSTYIWLPLQVINSFGNVKIKWKDEWSISEFIKEPFRQRLSSNSDRERS